MFVANNLSYADKKTGKKRKRKKRKKKRKGKGKRKREAVLLINAI